VFRGAQAGAHFLGENFPAQALRLTHFVLMAGEADIEIFSGPAVLSNSFLQHDISLPLR
jgi:hypothetical protein